MVRYMQQDAWCVIYTTKELVPALASFLQIANLNKVPSFFGNICPPVVKARLVLKERVVCSLCSLCQLHCSQACTIHNPQCTLHSIILQFALNHTAGRSFPLSRLHLSWHKSTEGVFKKISKRFSRQSVQHDFEQARKPQSYASSKVRPNHVKLLP